MAEFLHVTATTDEGIYREILPQIRGLVDGEPSRIANMANVAAVLKTAFSKVSWVGFYLWDGRELVLGPFQGKPACVRIAPGKGVCGTAFSELRTLIVPDVETFSGHIVCDPDSRSEIVVPLIDGAEVHGVLDLDSPRINAFDTLDQRHLEDIASLVVSTFHFSQ